MTTTTYIARIPGTDVWFTRASATMTYTHALIVGELGEKRQLLGQSAGAYSWHQTEKAAELAAKTARTNHADDAVVVVPVEAREGGKAKVEKQLAAEMDNESHHGSAKPLDAKAKATTKKASATKKASTKKATAKAPAAPKADPVMDAVKAAGRKGITLAALAEATGKTRNATHGWTWRMAKAGKVVAVDGAKPRRFKVAPAGKASAKGGQ